jgi:uncharacterized protein (DUF2336 family)
MASTSLIDDLERALSASNEAQRVEMLSRVTSLFIADSGKYSPQQVNLFDELLTRFVTVIEAKARARLASRLASVVNAPAGVIRTLAFDDDIEVARTVLRESDQIDENDLVANANSKSQQHLLAISERKSLSEAVTDVLVARGNPEVAHAVAKNAGARFSFAGFRTLVRRSTGDDRLAALVGSRDDLPRQQMLRLLDVASAEVRARLLAQNPDSIDAVQEVIAEVGGSIREEIRGFNYAAVRPKVEALRAAGQLNEAVIAQYAREERFEETAIALSLLCEINIDVVERGLLAPGLEVLLILLKLAGFSWATTKLVLQLKAANRSISPKQLEQAVAHFSRLNVGAARKAIGYYSSRAGGFDAAPASG